MKFWIFLLVSLFTFLTANAKYKYPEGVKTATERNVERQMKAYDMDKKEGLTMEEYENSRKVRTRDDRRQERRAKKKGTYVSPEDAFKQMDKDGDGIISQQEMLEYERTKLKQ